MKTNLIPVRFRALTAPLILLALCSLRCGNGGGTTPSVSPEIAVTVIGSTSVLDTGASRTFTASVQNTSNTTVTWSVVEQGGGSITQGGVYAAPAIPGTYTVKATSQADPSASGTARVPVVIPVGHIQGYDVGVDYHAYGTDFLHTAFITIYNQPDVRQTVKAQLQGMADRGATVISTRIWFVTESGTTNFGETWRATFPMSDQEQANLRAYAQDVAAIQGSGGNRLHLDLGFLWLGAADYTKGSPSTGLGFTPVSAAEFTSRVELTTDKVLSAVSDIYSSRRSARGRDRLPEWRSHGWRQGERGLVHEHTLPWIRL